MPSEHAGRNLEIEKKSFVSIAVLNQFEHSLFEYKTEIKVSFTGIW